MSRALAVVALLGLCAADAAAQDKTDADTPLPPREELPPPPLPPPTVPPDLWMDVMMRRSWEELPSRWFASTALDIGFLYLRPRLSAGYGKPFTRWVGIDVNPTISGNAFGLYGGLRLNLPRFNWRVGGRYVWSLYRTYLDPQESYDRVDFDLAENPRSRLLTLESEIEWSLPLGPGDIIGLGSVSNVRNIPGDDRAFEETLRVIVDAGWVWRGRGGYVLRFGTRKQHSAGVVLDVLAVPGRDDSLTMRLGPVVRIVLSRRVEVRGSFVVTFLSPDELGLAGSDFTEIGLRYRWATE